MTAKRTRKKSKTRKRAQAPVSPVEKDTGLALIEEKRRRRAGPRPRSSEIQAAAARLQTVLKSETLKDRDQEAGVVEEARRLLDELVNLLDRQRPENPLRDLAVEGAHDAIELRSIGAHYVALRKRVRSAEAAYQRTHKDRDVVRALEIPTPRGRPKISHQQALRRYVVLYRLYRHEGPLCSVEAESEKQLLLSKARLLALAGVREEFGYSGDKAALAGLHRANRDAEEKAKKRSSIRALLPTRTEIKAKTAPSK